MKIKLSKSRFWALIRSDRIKEIFSYSYKIARRLTSIEIQKHVSISSTETMGNDWMKFNWKIFHSPEINSEGQENTKEKYISRRWSYDFYDKLILLKKILNNMLWEVFSKWMIKSSIQKKAKMIERRLLSVLLECIQSSNSSVNVTEKIVENKHFVIVLPS